MEEKERYIGSVRFYKNMILLFVIVAIITPMVFAFVNSAKYHSSKEQAEDLQAEVSDLQRALAEEDESRIAIEAEAPVYQSLYPDFYAPQSYQATVYTEKTAYLTFDDGPSERTDAILDVLKKKNVKATFFVVGKTDAKSKERMKRIVAEGHTIGMHSYSHRYSKIYESVEAYLADMYKIFTLIKETTGVTPSVFRFPGGTINAYNGNIYRELCTEMVRRGFVPYDWNLSSGDATTDTISEKKIISNVVNASANVTRGFVLMHDSEYRDTTVAALDDVIDQMQKKGFTFLPITPDVQPCLFSYQDYQS